jgi:hypothetical protein
MSVRDDGAHVQMIRHVHDGHRDRFVDVREHVLEPIVARAAKRFVLLGADAELGHRLYGPHGILADGGFGREHHGVGAVHDGVRHVRHFGARRRRRVDHRFQHLRGRDADLVARAREPDEAFLQPCHRCVTDFDGEIAARHHDDVARVDDRADVGDGFRALDLGHDMRMTAGCA